jgi:hypothetical protein
MTFRCSSSTAYLRFEFIDAHNDDAKSLVWHKSADEILGSIARFAAQTMLIISELTRD